MHRLIATLGPSSFEHAGALVQAGATELRLNASHMTPDEVLDRCAKLRAEFPTLRCVVDLQGKKMRIGPISPRQLDIGAHLILSSNPNDLDSVWVPHPELFAQVALGERLSLDDGRIEIQMTGRDAGRLVARVLRAGLLRSRKGINRVEHPIELFELIRDDREIISRCRVLKDIDFAVSFASDGSEAGWVRAHAAACRVILKVERREAIEHLSDLADSADELWICRGDLGAQLGLGKMASLVAQVHPRRYSIPVLMAGQVLEHLSFHDAPTRSEVCHLHDLLVRGYAGIVLSDETAIGVAPGAATRCAAQLMRDIAAAV